MPQLLASELSASALSDSSGQLPDLLLGTSPVHHSWHVEHALQ